MTLDDYKIYCATHPTDDPSELTYRLWAQTRGMIDEVNARRDREQLKQEIIEEVLKRIQIEVKDEASPTIKKINEEISAMFKR